MKVIKTAVREGFKPFVMSITFENEAEVDAFKSILNLNKTAWKAIEKEYNMSNEQGAKVWDNISAKMYSALNSNL